MRGSFNVGSVKPGFAFFQNSVWVMRRTTSPVFLSWITILASVQLTMWLWTHAAGVVGIVLRARAGIAREGGQDGDLLGRGHRGDERATEEREPVNASLHEVLRLVEMADLPDPTQYHVTRPETKVVSSPVTEKPSSDPRRRHSQA